MWDLGCYTGIAAFAATYLYETMERGYHLHFRPTLSPIQWISIHSYYFMRFKRFPTPLLLEATYTTARLGSFEILKQRSEACNGGCPISLLQEASCGMTAGAMGAFFGSPIYLASHRIEAAPMPYNQSYSKTLLLHLCNTAKEKGVLALWKGGGFYTAWAMALNMGMLASYGQSVDYFKEFCGLNDLNAHISGAIVSGFCASACSLTCSNTYSTMKFLRENYNDKHQFSGFSNCFLKSLELEGLDIFYKGFLRHYSRTAPHVMLTLMCWEGIRGLTKEQSM